MEEKVTRRPLPSSGMMEKQEEKMEDMVCCPEDQKVVEDGNSDHVSLRGAGESEKVSQPQLIVVLPLVPSLSLPDPRPRSCYSWSKPESVLGGSSESHLV